MAPRVQKPYVQFRVSDEVYADLRELCERAKARGAENTTPNKLARVLMQTAMSIDENTIVPDEILIQVYSMRQQIGVQIGNLIKENLERLLQEAEENS